MNLLSNIFAVAILTVASFVDVQKKVIPNTLIIIGSVIGIVMLFLNTEIAYISVLAAVVVIGGIFLIISFVTEGSFGMGDVKLIACLALFVGLEKLIGTLFVSFIASGFIGLIFLIRSKKNAKKELPFAPFLLLGLIVILLF
jgi:leader peptidase (prepilin peptidase)/N-methyltransferase